VIPSAGCQQTSSRDVLFLWLLQLTKALLLTVATVATALTRRHTLYSEQSLHQPTGGFIKNCQLSWKPKVHHRSHNSARLVLIVGQNN